MKNFTRISSVLLALLMVLTMSVTVFATEPSDPTETTAPVEVDGSVTYEGRANEFIFAPGSEYSPTDLFTNFKGVMPGDSLTEQILVTNAKSTGMKIKIYMRALGAQEGTDDFLSQMTLTVKKNADAVLFDAPANETAQLTEWVYLGTLSAGGEATLDVTLNVPIEMGNDYAQKIGYLDWQFKIEEIPDPPKTGDESNIALYTALAVVSLLLLTAVVLVYKRKKTA